mgnify:CR=1 FL=1
MSHDRAANLEIAKLLRLFRPEKSEPDKIIGTMDDHTLEFRRSLCGWTARMHVIITLESGMKRNLYYNITVVATELRDAWDAAQQRAHDYDFEAGDLAQKQCHNLCRQWLEIEE